MTETARALNAEEAAELIHSHIDACLNGGPNRKAEDIELGRRAGLKAEMISALWDEAEKHGQPKPSPPQKRSSRQVVVQPQDLLLIAVANKKF